MSLDNFLARLRPWRTLSRSLDQLRQEVAILRNDVELLRQDHYHRETKLRQDSNDREAILRQELIAIKETRQKESLPSLMMNRLALCRVKWQADERRNSRRCAPITPEAFEVYLERFKALHPHLYEAWAAINFGSNVIEFRERPEGSCSVGAHPCAFWFAGFVAPYLRGQVLDLGCGPYPLPIYLQGYPLDFISGIDPLPPFEPHPFEFVQGFAEFLPWKDASFDVAIAATSLDHVMSLDLTLREVKRVLKPQGLFLAWEGIVRGSERYDPSDKNLRPVDNFHLFHFDDGWFEETIAPHFSILEKVNLDGMNVFYALKEGALTETSVRTILQG